MKKQFLRIMTLWVIVALFLASCAGGSGVTGTPGAVPDTGTTAAATPDGAVPGTGEKVAVKLATWAGVDEANELQGIIDELNASATAYTITQESSPSEYWTKIQTTLAGGTAADLLWVDQEHLPDLAQGGALLDITSMVEVGGDHPAANLDDYFETSINAYRYQGKLYGLPWIGMPVMLYVNLDYLSEAGIEESAVNDWTWEDFQQACQKLTVDANGKSADAADFDPDNVTRYGFSLVPGWPPVQQFIWQAGGEVISEDMQNVPLDSPEAIQGAQFVSDLANKFNCTPAQSVISERGFGEMMKGGQVAMFMGGAADDFERTEGMNIKAFLLPKGPVNRDSWAYIGGMSINARTPNPEAAFQAFMDLTQAIQEWKVPSPRKSLANVEGIIRSADYKEVSAENIIANMENMRAPRIFPGYAEWSTIFGERFVDPLVRGTGTAEELAGEVKPLLEERLRAAPQPQ